MKWSSKDGRISKLNDLVTDSKYLYLWTDFSSKAKVEDLPKLKIHHLIESLILMCKNESLDFENTDNLKKEIATNINRFKEEDSGAKVNYWHLCRLVLTGSNEGPPIVEIFQVLGKENLISRLMLAKKLLN